MSIYIEDVKKTNDIYIYDIPEPFKSVNFSLISPHYDDTDNKTIIGSVFSTTDGIKNQPYVRIKPKEDGIVCGTVVYPIA